MTTNQLSTLIAAQKTDNKAEYSARVTAYVALRDLATYANSADQRLAQVDALVKRIQGEV